MNSKKAVALFSGGLDSLIAMKIIKDEGVEVVGINFNTGFGSKDNRRDKFKELASQIGVEVLFIDIVEQFFDDILFKPKHGYGRFFNPCIDCHGNMFNQAKKIMDRVGADFIISGEVVGQRPKSQRREAIMQVNALTDLDGLIVRPLSAKLLPETIPAKEGWIDIDNMYAIEGRSRETQLELAEKWGLEYEPPAGGCLLTEHSIAYKIKDILSYKEPVVEDIETIKRGRYLILPDGSRMIVSRNSEENDYIENLEHRDFIHMHVDFKGPLAILSKNASESDKLLASRILLTYGKSEEGKEYQVKGVDLDITTTKLDSKEEIQQYMLMK